MPETPDIKALQEQIFDLVARSQGAVLDAGRSFTDSVSQLAPGDTSAVNDIIDRAFDLTTKVLDAQREFAKQVVQTVTAPVAGGDGGGDGGDEDGD
jgi:hypothetical protein